MAPHLGVIGGGLVGLATALRLLERLPGLRLTLWEKEPGVGRHQSTHNSGVLHAGLYYRPGSLKARLAVAGIREMTAYCRAHAIRHEICGKLVTAVSADQVPRLRQLEERGRANGLQGLRWIAAEEIPGIEPHARGLAALHVPEEGIVDYAGVVAQMARDLAGAGADIICGAAVLGMARARAAWEVRTTRGEFTCDFLVNCAGLHSDRVAALAGHASPTRIVPFRGEYYVIRPERRHLVRHLIYPVPDPTFPFLGVHFTRRIDGAIEAGPNAVLALAREGYSRGDFNLRDALGSVAFPGLWRFLRRHVRMCAGEMHRSLSRAAFCRSLQALVPEIRPGDLLPGGSGVRAQAMEPDGELVQDFVVLSRPGAVHLVNAPSPAATASLAIGGHVAGIVADRLSPA